MLLINKNKVLQTFFLTLSTTLILPIASSHINAETNGNFLSKTIEKPSSGEQRVIITYKNSVTENAKQKVEDIGDVQQEFENLNAVSMEVPTEDINSIKNNPNVKSVEKDIILKVKYYEGPLPNQTTTYPIIALNGKEAWDSGLTGAGVRVAVIDTGVARHSDLIIAGGQSFVDYSPDSYTDDNGHGTHVAGLISAESNTIGIQGISPDSRIYALKVLDSNGEGYLSDIISAIEWSVENNMDIINLSLGSSQDSPLLKQAIDNAYNNGILVVAAAGNEGQGVSYPAKYDNVIAVSAIDESRQLADFSNRGPEIEVAAPGVDILSTYLGGNYYITLDGTSMATPYVSGVLALWKQYLPNASVSELRTKLQQNVIDLGASGRDINFGYGLVQSPTATNKPAIPTNFKASNVTSSSVNLSWSPSQGATTYKLYRNGTKIFEGTNTSFVDNTLTPYTYYKYEIYASNGTTSSVYPATTGIISLPLTPQLPSNFSTINITGNSISLKWDISNYATYYQLKRNGVLIYKGTQTNFVDKNLIPNTNYRYELMAGNYAKTSNPSILSVSTNRETISTPLNAYVFSTYNFYKKGSSVLIGVYSRHSGNVSVPWARFDLTVTGPKGLVYKTTKYTDQNGRYTVSLPTNKYYPVGKYDVKVVMSKTDFSPTSKFFSFYLN